MRGSSVFTQEQIEYLKSLPAVVGITKNRIEYSDTFKYECVRRYRQGESPAKIFRDAGLDSSLIGYKRIERCISRWKQSTAPWTKGKFMDGGVGDSLFTTVTQTHSDQHDLRDMLIAQQIRRINELEEQVDALMRELRQLENGKTEV